MPDSTLPALSVVVVTPERFCNIRRTVRHLRAQTVRDRIELVIVAPTEPALSDAEAHELDGFASVVRVAAGPVSNVDHASAAGVRAARAPFVSVLEDHAFADARWAEATLAAVDGRPDVAVVGSTVTNANPASGLSWTNLLLAFGWWTEPAAPGDVDALPGHNITYRREALLALDADGRLDERLTRGGDALDALRAAGGQFVLGGGRVAHANPSRLGSTAALRFDAGRIYGSARARTEGWSTAKRALYTVAGPAIPLVRLARVRAELFPGSRAALLPRLYPALALGLVLDGLGQMAGYAFGAGGAPERLATFEMDRLQHLHPADRALFEEPTGEEP